MGRSPDNIWVSGGLTCAFYSYSPNCLEGLFPETSDSPGPLGIGPGPSGLYPSSTGALLNTLLTISLQVLSNGPVRGTYHLLRGRMFLSFPAAVYNIYPYGSPAPFCCSPPVLSPQDRSGVTAANFHIILCEPSCPVGGLPPSFVAFLVWLIFEREAIRS